MYLLFVQESRDSNRQKEKEKKDLVKEHKKCERELVKEGKKPFYLTKGKCHFIVPIVYSANQYM